MFATFLRCWCQMPILKLVTNTLHKGYVSFEDGEVFAELEVDIEPYILEKEMKFVFSIEDVRGCRISSDLNRDTFVTVNPPENIPKGFGFVEFVKDTYSGNGIYDIICGIFYERPHDTFKNFKTVIF